VMDWCCMCRNNGKSIDHLLHHCRVTRELWVFFRLFGVEWVMPNQMVDLLASWSGCFGSHRYLEAWRMAPHCVM
jgi:hypothetical protein